MAPLSTGAPDFECVDIAGDPSTNNTCGSGDAQDYVRVTVRATYQAGDPPRVHGTDHVVRHEHGGDPMSPTTPTRRLPMLQSRSGNPTRRARPDPRDLRPRRHGDHRHGRPRPRRQRGVCPAPRRAERRGPRGDGRCQCLHEHQQHGSNHPASRGHRRGDRIGGTERLHHGRRRRLDRHDRDLRIVGRHVKVGLVDPHQNSFARIVPGQAAGTSP